MDIESIRVGLKNRSYDILIGPQLIEQVGKIISSFTKSRKIAVITDTHVEVLYFPVLRRSLIQYGFNVIPVVMKAGEDSKSFSMLEYIVNHLLMEKLERGDYIIALGGGVVGDLSGFAAAVIRRGIGLIQIPTSLLAQVDSSVGGKTGINTNYGKNLIGVFYQPKLVIVDTLVLDTLPLREFRAGYAEVVKYGLIDQPNFFFWLEKEWKSVFAGGSKRVEAIACSCRFKASFIEGDEYEIGRRALLNFGHTFGHALETVVGYNSGLLVHGEGVSIGMVLACELSARMELISSDLVKRVRNHLQAVGLPTRMSEIPGIQLNADALMDCIEQDKKRLRTQFNFILIRGIGDVFLAENLLKEEVYAFIMEKVGERH
ncbi:MAG: 3-dehydroquinate synthase [Candidatus Tokpelaia sp. JSC161]|jgi:3-dehydroquinate synthase|nr:MAG: 3-dehydroquinate synthase [Candidatus Tokpelaia sp. JSC161]